MDFDWDSANVGHIARHKVEPEEAEEAATDPAAIAADSIYRGPNGQRRSGLIGATETGRVLFLVLEERQGKLRVATARPANTAERLRYETEE